MKDLLLVFQYLLNWKFLAALILLLTLGWRLPPSFTKPFRSVRFNVWLFLLIAAVSAFGTFFPQYDLYHSWWFAGLLVLMAFDVVVCKLRTWPGSGTRHAAKISVDPDTWLSKMRHRAEIESSHPVVQTGDKVREWLRRKKLAWSEERADMEKKNILFFTASRHTIQKWGDFILHVSIVVVLAGNLMGAMFGFEESLPVEEGGRLRMSNRPYEVALDNFDIEYYRSTGAPSLYASDLSVYENGHKIAQKRIVVNDPLDIGRVRFYQASWGMTTKFRSVRLRLASREFTVLPNEILDIPGTPLSVRVNRFLPTFAIDSQGKAVTADYQGNNPAVQIDFLEKGKVRVSLWILRNRPEQAFQIGPNGLSRTSPPPFQLLSVDPVLFSGIQVGYDPGAPLFWFGALWLLAGLGMHFYLHQRRLRIVVERTGHHAKIRLGGWNSRTTEDFNREFMNWTSELERIVT